MIPHRLYFALVAILVAGCGALESPASQAGALQTTVSVDSQGVTGETLVAALASPTSPAQPNSDILVSEPDYPSPVLPYATFVRVPAGSDKESPLTLVVALHGMHGDGKDFANVLAGAADRNRWVIAGPTISYGDWLNPESVASEDAVVLQRLRATIRSIPALTGRRLKPLVKLFGFSRGAQIAHRYAIAYSEDVSSVVAYSAGTYTLPLSSADIDLDGRPDTLVFPYGIADLSARIGHAIDRSQVRRVRFLIGVGANDNRPGDVPRQWDSYVGKSRVERAQQFSNVLAKSGSNCTLKVFPGADHEVTRDMLSLAENFLASDEAAPSLLLQ